MSDEWPDLPFKGSRPLSGYPVENFLPDLSPNVMDQRYPLYDGSCNNRIVPGRGQAYQIGCSNKNAS